MSLGSGPVRLSRKARIAVGISALIGVGLLVFSVILFAVVQIFRGFVGG